MKGKYSNAYNVTLIESKSRIELKAHVGLFESGLNYVEHANLG